MIVVDYIDYSQLDGDYLASWETLYDRDKLLSHNLLNLLKKTVWLPLGELAHEIVCIYMLVPSALARVCPILLLNGARGTGKSTIGFLASKLHGVHVHTSADSFPAIRNDLESRKWMFDRELKKPIERNAILIWDDIDEGIFTAKPDIYRMLKFGYDKESDTISISTTKPGVNMQFRCFCPKILSSCSPLHVSPNTLELQRRMLLVKTKKVEEFTEAERIANNIHGELFATSRLDLSQYSWKGFEQEFVNFWSEDFARLYVSVRKAIVKSPPKLDSHQLPVSIDLLATGLASGVWNSEREAYDKIRAYWDWHSRTCSDNLASLAGLLGQLAQIAELNAKNIDSSPEINSRHLRECANNWHHQGMLETEPSPKAIGMAMAQLGYRLKLGKWVKE
ncbi:MAG: hypothetical protein ACRC11_08145 [Xenococcaceae cyanobacterium]